MFALFSNTGGSLNTATGSHALFSNTGTANTADGTSALLSNTTGHDNTANGLSALYSNTIGSNNTASGSGALFGNLDGDSNTAVGAGALLNNTSGASNTATGLQALYFNTTGSNNIAFGAFAGYNLTGGSDNIEIGNGGDAGDTSTIRIGEPATQNRAFIAGIHGVTTGNGDAIAVLIDSAGQLGTMSSSARFKKNVKTMGEASEAILALNPVTFQYKTDKTGIQQFGLIAEEVAQVNPDLVVRDKNGEIYSVRYDQVNAMLLNEFLKEHRKVEQQDRKLERQEATIAKQQKQIDALTAGLQKVSAQLATASSSLGGLQASKFATGRIRGGGPAPQVVNNP
ncbi:MAG TPA: tail fiber domain-containing protein [Candidatus Udaeobacter sp.]|nr:tail fiber domain-containing protein [Candidatus Udaeobacter sp.]